MESPPPSYDDVLKDKKTEVVTKSYVTPTFIQPGGGNGGGYQQCQTYRSTEFGFHPRIPESRRQIIVYNVCPACGVGSLDEGFSCAGLCWAVLFFPLGILCCLASREKQCDYCYATYPM